MTVSSRGAVRTLYICCVSRGLQSSRDRALAYLRESVLANPAVEGTFLSENELAEQIGVSRTPVREALLLLAADGVVTMVSGRGAYVPPVSGREMRDLMQLRGVLERFAASTAISEKIAPVEYLKDVLNEQYQIAASGGDGELDTAISFIDWDIRFHQSLIDAVGNEILARTYAGLRVRQRRVGVAALFRTADRQQAVCDEHRHIVEALALDDTAATHEAIDDHLKRTLVVLLGV